jgi:thiosulfate/3-mercaptopyruvate sulfurtransferase
MSLTQPTSLLVDCAWLASRLDDPRIRIVDCDQPDGYRRAHLPGAVALPVNHYLKQTEDDPHVMGESAFAALAGRLGIGDDTHVVAYDTWGGLYAARLWWALGYYGHDRASVLNGGFSEWFGEGRPVTREVVRPAPRAFVARRRPDWIELADDLAAGLGRAGRRVLDVRSEAEWTGQNRRGTRRGGRIPGAVHYEWLETLTRDERMVFRPLEEIRADLAARGVTPEQEVVTY